MSTPETIGSLDAPMPGAVVPVVNQALEPASVRNGTPAVKRDYANALSFESVLVNQLCQQLVQTTGLSSSGDSSGGDDGDGSDPTVSDFASLLPGALASSIMSDGGLGLAAQLIPSLDGSASTTDLGSAAGGSGASQKVDSQGGASGP
ncbi:MAG: hypothetical protein ABSG64_09725 [Solirubrobacteraceae bacterium]